MPKCPKCNEEISWLDATETKKTTGSFYSKNDFDIESSEVIEEAWSCPECGEQLFSTDKEADEFLMAKVTAMCPRCGAGVDHLNVIENRNYHMEYTSNGFVLHDGGGFDLVDRIWSCPVCEEELFSIEESALEFFRKEVQNGDKS